MAQFHFYATQDEWWPLLDVLVREHNVRFTPDRWYSSPECPYYDRVDEEARAAVEKPRVFLTGLYSETTLLLNRQPSGPKAGQYSIDLSRGGPWIDLIFPRAYEEEGTRRFVAGTLTRRAEYWSSDGQTARKASPQFKAAYDAMKRTLQHRLVRANFGEVVWISRPALAITDSGGALIMVNGRWIGRTS